LQKVFTTCLEKNIQVHSGVNGFIDGKIKLIEEEIKADELMSGII
jgi:hypothetical protein